MIIPGILDEVVKPLRASHPGALGRPHTDRLAGLNPGCQPEQQNIATPGAGPPRPKNQPRAPRHGLVAEANSMRGEPGVLRVRTMPRGPAAAPESVMDHRTDRRPRVCS